MTGDTLDLSRLIKQRLGDRSVSEFAREAGVSVQTATMHVRADRPMQTSPGRDVLDGYRRALPCRIQPLWTAVGRTIFGADFDDPRSLLQQELDAVVGTEALDEDPAARAVLVAVIEEFVLIARRARG